MNRLLLSYYIIELNEFRLFIVGVGKAFKNENVLQFVFENCYFKHGESHLNWLSEWVFQSQWNEKPSQWKLRLKHLHCRCNQSAISWCKPISYPFVQTYRMVNKTDNMYCELRIANWAMFVPHVSCVADIHHFSFSSFLLCFISFQSLSGASFCFRSTMI